MAWIRQKWMHVAVFDKQDEEIRKKAGNFAFGFNVAWFSDIRFLFEHHSNPACAPAIFLFFRHFQHDVSYCLSRLCLHGLSIYRALDMTQVSVHNRVRGPRFEHDEVTRQELTGRVGCTRQTIHVLEKERYVPSLSRAFKIARCFGKAIEEVSVCVGDGGRRMEKRWSSLAVMILLPPGC